MKLLSPAIKAATAFTLGGAGFALANLLLARHLPTADYGQFSLVLAVILLCTTLGPLGLEAVVLRHRPGPNNALFAYSLASGAATGLIAVVLTFSIYQVDTEFLPFIFIGTAAGTVTRVCASIYQSEKQFKASLWLIQSPFLTLVTAAFLAGIFSGIQAHEVIALYAVHWVLAALVGILSVRKRLGISAKGDWSIPWRECPPLFGFVLTVQLAAQLDRLIIPKLLDIENLATFGVLAALVMAPFKMFMAGVGFTLVPRLRVAEATAERWRILIHEAGSTALVIAGGAASGFLLAPWISEIFLNGRYPLGPALVGATVFAGSLRLFVIFVSSIVTALGERRHLTWLNHGSWAALITSLAGGWWGSQWGLAGLIFGFALGNLVRIGAAAWIATRVWRRPAPEAGEFAAPT